MIKRMVVVLLASVLVTGLFSPERLRAQSGQVIPPGEAGAKAFLEKSPRHHEWVDIAVPGSGSKITSFVAYPERKDKAPVVIVIMEIFGLTDWIRAVADQLAEEGFIAIAPDLLTGKGGTQAFSSRDDVVKAVRELQQPAVVEMLNAVAAYSKKIPSSNGRFATVGFCWGGAQSFSYAAAQPDLAAAVVYYGTSPSPEDLARVRAPVLGLYGEDDARVNTTVGPAVEKMKELGKPFVTHTYKGAGHGFLRAQGERDGANLEASKKAWPETIEHLRKHTK